MNLKSLNGSLRNAEAAIAETISSLDIRATKPWTMAKPGFYQLAIFREMGYKEIFKAYFTGIENRLKFFRGKKFSEERLVSFNTIYANISHIEVWANTTFLDLNGFINKYNAYGDKRNEALNKLRIYWEKLSTTDPETVTFDDEEYLNKLFHIIHQYSAIPTNERVNPFVSHRKLVLPIRILNKQFVSKVDTRELNNYALEASNQYVDMEKYLRVFRSQVGMYRDSLSTVYASNEQIIRVLG